MTQARPPEVESGHSSADRRVESALGYVLRAGVVLAVLVSVCGAVLLLRQHDGATGRQVIAQASANPAKTAGLAGRIAAGDGSAIILLGLFILLSTPVLRVASMIVAFAWEKDFLYAAISAAVLGILLFGILFAG